MDHRCACAAAGYAGTCAVQLQPIAEQCTLEEATCLLLLEVHYQDDGTKAMESATSQVPSADVDHTSQRQVVNPLLEMLPEVSCPFP